MPPRTKFKTVDQYMKAMPPQTEKALQQIRRTIKKLVPKAAEEVISYNIPTIKMDGKYIIYFSGYAKHVSLYPIPRGSAAFQKKIAKYVAGKGTIKFPLSEPIPMSIVELVTKIHVKEHKAAAGASRGSYGNTTKK